MRDELLEQILGSLNDLKSEQQSTNKLLDGMDERFNKMDSRFDRVEGKLENLEAGHRDLQTDMKEIKTEQQTVKQAVLETNEIVLRVEIEQQFIKQAVLETNESVKHLGAIQEQQHRIIEMLSVRSIDHEGILKRIK